VGRDREAVLRKLRFLHARPWIGVEAGARVPGGVVGYCSAVLF
jgi:hypothetical protein